MWKTQVGVGGQDYLVATSVGARCSLSHSASGGEVETEAVFLLSRPLTHRFCCLSNACRRVGVFR